MPTPQMPQPIDDAALREFEHPRGTLALVIIVFLLFTLGWFAMYFFMFLQRGVPHP